MKIQMGYNLRTIKLNSQLQSQIKSTGVYLLVPVVNFAVSIFSTPYFAKYLSAEEFGQFGYYNSITSVIGILFSLSFNTYYMSVYHRVEAPERKVILQSITLFLISWNIFFLPFAYYVIVLFIKYSGSAIQIYPLFAIALAGASIGIFKFFLQSDFRFKNNAFLYLLIVSGYRILSTLAGIYLVMHKSLGIHGRMLGIFIVEIAFFVISLIYIFRKGKIKFDKSKLSSAWKVVLPLLPASMLYVLLVSYDNFVLERINEPKEMGFYNIGKGIAYYVYIALFPFYQTFETSIYQYTIQKKIKNLKKIITGLLLMVSASVVIFWGLSGFVINYLTAGKYPEAVVYANITVMTSGLMILFSINDAMINALQKSKSSLLINAITVIAFIFICNIAAAHFKQIGVAYSTVLGYVLLIVLQSVLIIRTMKIKSGLKSQ